MSTTLYMLNSYSKYCFDPQCDNPEDLPNQTGLYMICVKNKAILKEKMPSAVYPKFNDMPIIYIGKSETQGLRNRDYRNHFNGTSRNSTLRKSLGSLLIGEQTEFMITAANIDLVQCVSENLPDGCMIIWSCFTGLI